MRKIRELMRLKYELGRSHREMVESRVERPVRVIGEVGVHNRLSPGIEVDDMYPSLAVGADWSRTVEFHGSVPSSTDLPQESSFSI